MWNGRTARARAAVLVPTLLATALLARHLGHQPLWYDEIATVSAAGRSLHGLGLLLHHTDAVLGPYYLLMHAWTALGVAPAWVRLPSLIAAVATVGLTAAAGTRLRGPAVGLLAGLMLATNPFLAFYAHDARPYALATLACVLAGYLLLPSPAATSAGRRRSWPVVATAAVYLHLFAVLVLAVQALTALRSAARRRWIAPVASVVVAAAPLAWIAVRERGELAWVPRASAATYLSAWSQLSGGYRLAVVDAVLVGAALLLARRDTVVRVLAFWLVLPAAALVTVSLVKPIFVARYALPSVPALALLSAVGLVEVARRVTATVPRAAALAPAGALALLLTASSTVLAQQNRAYAYENMPAAADLVLDGARQGDAIAFLSGSARASLDYYLRRLDLSAPRPPDVLLATGSTPSATGTFGGRDVPIAIGLQHVVTYPRVWVVDWTDTHGVLARRLLATLRGRYREVEHRRFGQAKVALWARLPTGRAPVISG